MASATAQMKRVTAIGYAPAATIAIVWLLLALSKPTASSPPTPTAAG
jgi:hypothetical protein